MVNVIENDPAWGESGSLHAWPEASDMHGQTWQLDKVRSPEHHTCRKFYIPPEQAVSWAALRHEGKRCALRLEWSAQELPYLGLWVDEGVYNSRPVAAFEPTNAYYDSLVWAVENGRVPVLEAGDAAEWRLTIRYQTLASRGEASARVQVDGSRTHRADASPLHYASSRSGLSRMYRLMRCHSTSSRMTRSK